ncbi:MULTISPECIES: mannose-6-phosphate isomerase, class I [Bacillus]|uniref:Mannose-6-phosphate isomerase n=2 Tax=Bacillus TaxID=1386 RepID=A0A0M4FVE7_9BACI|nr:MULTISPECIES: mannose-6-phosphate isomerase, class I [Bacillus]ALC82543.1 mannose-6-phosphate isomerase [Bacillus gobiensis]MBP1081452.1 mannose-6-phosphate isomerase [Bacillus capparidis]MED1096123.1 mannose-6-phosphate isomerase, class I [Bacillus capparidis]
MSQSPIFLIPEFKDRIWGGTALKDQFEYDIPSETTGECWAISAHPNGPNKVASGPYEGKTLIELWENHRELFGNVEGKAFPLLTKILDANKDLSVQVHPDDIYANENENGELGKTECWYIIDCKENAEMIYGHTARSKTELVTMVNSGDWDGLLRRVAIKPGDFFYVPSGTIHALCEGTLVLETQQSSDTTYRVYDYDRTDQSGNKRELHLNKAIDVTTVPHVDGLVDESTSQKEGITIKTFVQAEYFSVYKWDVDGQAELSQEHPFMLGSVIAGEAALLHEGVSYPLKKGSHFILPAETGDFQIEGTCTIIASHV